MNTSSAPQTLLDTVNKFSEQYDPQPLRLNFPGQIEKMNRMYELPVHSFPCIVGSEIEFVARLDSFENILAEELTEIQEISAYVDTADSPNQLTALVMLADLLGDLVVYIRSEAMRFGIPLEEVLEIIMESNFSKLGADGKPIKDERGKFLKGPQYWKPEPKIRELLESHIAAANPKESL